MLIQDLSRDAYGKISSSPMESLARPVLALVGDLGRAGCGSAKVSFFFDSQIIK